MRIMGLDVGDKRIGVAISDPDGWLAQTLTVIERVSPKRDVHAILDLAREYEVDKIVVGLPRTMAGEIGEQARKVQAFGQEFEQRAGIQLVYWDERLSTAGAQRLLIAAGAKRAKRKQMIDAAAAAFILQGYLDFVRSQTQRQAELGPYED